VSQPIFKKRAVALPGTSVGLRRYDLYKEAYARIKLATQQGFYLEAITITESLISDRLESRLSFVKKSDFSFKTLGALIKDINHHETDGELKEIISSKLDEWRVSRNKAMHEIVKISETDTRSWVTRIGELSSIAKEGLSTLRTIDKRCAALQKTNL